MPSPIPGRKISNPKRIVTRLDSVTTEEKFGPSNPQDSVEYFFASDASALIEHTRKVVYLEDNDVAAVADGVLTITRIIRPGIKDLTTGTREVTTLKMELEEIRKGNYETFMQKEIFEQPESVVRTMLGRVNHETGVVKLGGIEPYLTDIRRCRKLIIIGCGTSYHSAVATRALIQELTQLPVMLEMASEFLDCETPVFQCFRTSQVQHSAILQPIDAKK